MNQLSLTISGIDIACDEHGRFNLSDLHRASGSQKCHQPSDWLRLQQTKELITELRKPVISSVPGNPGSDNINHLEPVNIVKSFFMTQGTFVVEELVYSYAMWISPAFHLKVIRAYALQIKGETRFMEPQPAPQPKPQAQPATVEDRLGSLEDSMNRMAHHMANLVQVSAQQAHKLDMTARYIGLLEINQKGNVKVTRQVEAEAFALAAQGMSITNIGKMLRISRTTASLILSGKYELPKGEAALPPVSVEEALNDLAEAERMALMQRIQGGAQ
jgi:hypothetical protein